jgi:hypothetical protein
MNPFYGEGASFLESTGAVRVVSDVVMNTLAGLSR